MSAKKNAASKKSSSTENAADSSSATNDQATETKAAAVKLPQKVRFYTYSGADLKCDERKGQAGLVCQALAALVVEDGITDRPVRADELASRIAEKVKDQYKIKNGDTVGSVGYHLHQLGRKGLLVMDDRRQDADGVFQPVEK